MKEIIKSPVKELFDDPLEKRKFSDIVQAPKDWGEFAGVGVPQRGADFSGQHIYLRGQQPKSRKNRVRSWICGEDITKGQAVMVGRDETLYSTDMDALVSEGDPDTNYGNLGTINAGNWGANAVRSFIKFDFTNLPLDNLISATLRLYCSAENNSSGNYFDVHRVTATWTEAGITWNNQSAYDATAEDEYQANGATGWKTWDITSLVTSWLDGTYSNYGVVVKTRTESGDREMTFHSSEGANSPELILVFDTEKIFKAVATNSENTARFIGFSPRSKKAEKQMYPQTIGINPNQTGLTRGQVYYVSDTPGAISSTAGTVTKQCGVGGTRTNELLITNI